MLTFPIVGACSQTNDTCVMTTSQAGYIIKLLSSLRQILQFRFLENHMDDVCVEPGSPTLGCPWPNRIPT